jgi:uncharacterized protein (TIGR02246 family)
MNVRALIDELVAAWEANDAHRASAFFAPEGVYAESGREAIVGRDAIFEHFKRFFRDGPAWRFFVDDVVVEGSRAAVVYRFEVKGGNDAWVSRAGCAFVSCAEGLITEWREFAG